MPPTSWLSRAYVPMWLRSRLAGIARVRSARLIRLARLASVGVFRIASLGPNSHREILQFFSNQTQFVNDLFSHLVFHICPFTFYIARGDWREPQLSCDLQCCVCSRVCRPGKSESIHD